MHGWNSEALPTSSTFFHCSSGMIEASSGTMVRFISPRTNSRIIHIFCVFRQTGISHNPPPCTTSTSHFGLDNFRNAILDDKDLIAKAKEGRRPLGRGGLQSLAVLSAKVCIMTTGRWQVERGD